MAKCRYYRMCWLMLGYDEFKWNPDCRGGGDAGCKRFEPMPNVKSLLALADEMDSASEDGLLVRDSDLMAWTRCIRKALGVEDA